MTLILHEPLEYPFRGRMTGSSCLVRSVTLGGGLPGWTPEFNRRMVFPQHRRSALGATGANGVVSDGFAECHLEVGHIPGKRWAGGMDSCSVHVSISPPSLLDDRCRPTSTSKGGCCGDGNDWMSLQRETLNCGVLQQPIACL